MKPHFHLHFADEAEQPPAEAAPEHVPATEAVDEPAERIED